MIGSIDYDMHMRTALLGLIRSVLAEISSGGLPGSHHFVINYDTTHELCSIPDNLLENNPEQMTIILQNWFDDLKVDDDGFAVTLNFGNVAERLYVPFDAINSFADPSVKLVLAFEDTIGIEPSRTLAQPEEQMQDASDDDADEGEEDDSDGEGAVILELDHFRK